VLALGDPCGKTKPKYQEPRLDCLRGEAQEEDWFFEVDRTPSPPVARTDKDVDDDANTSTSDNSAQGKAPVGRKTLGGPNHPSKDEMTRKEDDTGKDEAQEDNDNDDDKGTHTQPLSQWRYGVDPYTAINEKWHFSRFKVYNAALPPMHTIFGDDIKDGQIQGLELRRCEKCGINRDLVPLGLPYLIDGTYAEAYETVILCGEDALDHDFGCDMDALLEHNKSKRNKKMTPPWKRERKTIDAFHKAYPQKELRIWLRASEFTADLDHLRTWPVEIDLCSINQDFEFFDAEQALLNVEDDTIREAVGQFHDDCGLLRNDIVGFADDIIPHDYKNADILTANARFFVGRMDCRRDWAPATEALAKAAKKGKKKVDATPISTTPGAKKVTPKDTFLSYGKTSTTADKPTTRLAKVDAAIKAAEMEEVAPTPRPASQPRLILNKDDRALFDVYTMRPVFDDDLTNEAILFFRRQWQRDQPMEMALPLLNITTPTSPSPRLITNQGDRALFERYTRRPLLDDDICNEFILLCRRQYDPQATTSPVVTSTTPAPTTAAATKTAGRTPATTATKTGKDAIMNTWLRTPEKTTPAAPTSTPAPPTTTPAAPSTPPRAPTTPPTPTPAAPQPSPPPKPNRGAGCGRGRHYSRAITPLHTRYEEHQQDELKDGWRPVMSSLF
ncbi:uncharacterized protein K489DRAFT_383251, partial [Dissoconium aciculare CBS 342.82]|uniref:Uncharacterized protein n=1 Tax=Dissoconium aciculare CBS 342.82 TaxID=1314786 RepID=A0A6J3LVI2_9PEZI